VTLGVLTAGIIAPALFWICYFYYKDRFQPEPILNMGSSYILGFLTAFFCLVFYKILPYLGLPDDPSALIENNRTLYFFYSIVVIGLLEEFFKFLPFLLIVLRFKAFDEKIDGIIYASIIALGFASFENLIWLRHLEGFALYGRALASPLTHTIFASIWGYIIGSSRISGKSLFKASLIGLSISALSHGIFDFLTLDPLLRLISALMILSIWLWRTWVLKKEMKQV
jgi:RsiW-degrading membrane proteinase PrsW (M82 family)